MPDIRVSKTARCGGWPCGGQVIAWPPEPRFSHAWCAPILETLIRSAGKAAA